MSRAGQIVFVEVVIMVGFFFFLFLHFSFFFFYWFERLSDTEEKRERKGESVPEREPSAGFPNGCNGCSGWSRQKQGALSWSPTLVAGTQALGLFSVAFSGMLGGSWTASRAA